MCALTGCLPDVGSPEGLVVEFPLEEWSFTATFVPVTGKCVRPERVRLVAIGGRRFALRPVGHSGMYDVTLFGRGNGDLYVTFSLDDDAGRSTPGT
jgi:hypothetical protein